jgi:hypothetical protein
MPLQTGLVPAMRAIPVWLALLVLYVGVLCGYAAAGRSGLCGADGQDASGRCVMSNQQARP